MNKKMVIRKFNISEAVEIISIWNQCGLLHPPNDPMEEIIAKTKFQPDMFLVGTIDDRPMATIMLGYEGRRGWINLLCVLPEYRDKGFGRELVEHGLNVFRELGALKVNLLVRTNNRSMLEFYEKLGFKTDDAICMGYRFSDEKEIILQLS